MFSIKIICLIFCLQILIVRANKSPQDKVSNFTVTAEDRRDIYLKKPPRKRGTFGNSYDPLFGNNLHTTHLKSYSLLKKDLKPTLVEKYVPVPVHIRVPVDRPIPVHIPKLFPVTIEKAVPVPIKVNVPQPYPVYKKIAVPVRVPVDRPVPVQVFKPYPVFVEKQVPYPVDKPVPVPVKVPVDRPYPVYVAFEKSTEKPMMTQIKWLSEKGYSPSSGKSLTWAEKPDLSSLSFKLQAPSAEDADSEKLLSSWPESAEPSESEFTFPDSIELEIKK